MRKENEILWIHRLGKWDLPKGKVEKNEDYEKAAVREVEEETGVRAEITSFICSTYHTYIQNEKFYLKETLWYAMKSVGENELVPQLEENITQVCWRNENELNTLLADTYQTIKDVFTNYQKI